MFEGFTKEAQEVIALARTKARELYNRRVNVGNILSGLYMYGRARIILQAFDFRNNNVYFLGERKLDAKVWRARRRMPRNATSIGELPFDQSAQLLLDSASREAQERGAEKVSSIDLLLAFTRQNTRFGHQQLDRLFRARPDEVRSTVMIQLTQGNQARGLRQAARSQTKISLDEIEVA